MKQKKVKRIIRFFVSFFKKVISFLVFALLIVFAARWIPWDRFAAHIDTTEVDKYYELLREHEEPANVLTLSLGIREDDDIQAEFDKFGIKRKDSLPVALGRLKTAMGLADYDISLIYGGQKNPPAFITNFNQERMVITVSDKVTKRREQFNLLVHELSHVSVWGLDKSVAMNCGQEKGAEKVVDCSGFFRGQGILTLNGLTDQTTIVAGEGTSTEKKLFGYLIFRESYTIIPLSPNIYF